ncbi:hypothetical protein [Amycolatopsis rhizosphaerae]|uniref:hypothetical protein n=1 Tax=Amycolatopsis rhizosphaerae TaxID=2053003 RepID=UPI0016439FC4|nr:hypothetical protein [Amycolatopsis rhizosphaerae]
MGDDQPTTIFAQVEAVIAWEMEAQVGIERRVEAMPGLIADTLLDYFEIRLKPGVTLPQ